MVIFHLEDCPHSQCKARAPLVKYHANPKHTIYLLPVLCKRVASNVEVVQKFSVGIWARLFRLQTLPLNSLFE